MTQTTAEARMRRWHELMEERASRMTTQMKPQVVFHQLSRLLDEDRDARRRPAPPLTQSSPSSSSRSTSQRSLALAARWLRPRGSSAG